MLKSRLFGGQQLSYPKQEVLQHSRVCGSIVASPNRKPVHLHTPGLQQQCRLNVKVATAAGSLGMLQSAKKIDRLRYQAKLVFDYLDGDSDGLITLDELQQYYVYAGERLGKDNQALEAVHQRTVQQLQTAGKRGLDLEAFDDLFRAQIDAVSQDPTLLRNNKKNAEIAQLQWKSCCTPVEMTRVLAIFKLLDFNNDGYLKLDELRKAQGIEKAIVEDQLVDADENEDGFLAYEDFLVSYSKDRPVILNMVVLVANAAVFYGILNLLPFDFPIKAVLCMFVLMKPQVINNPVIKVYQILKSIWDRIRAEQVMFNQNSRASTA